MSRNSVTTFINAESSFKEGFHNDFQGRGNRHRENERMFERVSENERGERGEVEEGDSDNTGARTEPF